MQTVTPPSTLPEVEEKAERGWLAGLGRTCYRRRWLVLGVWVAIVVVTNVLAGAFGGDPETDFQLHGSESDRAGILLEEGGFGGRQGLAGQIVVSAEQGVDDPEVEAYLEDLFAEVESIDGVEVTSPFDEDAQSQISPDGTVAFADVGFGDVSAETSIDLAEEVKEVFEESDPPEGVVIEFGGDMFAEEIEFSSEAFGFLAAAIILFIAFGSVLAMGLPLATAAMGIIAGLALVTLWSNVLEVPGFAPNAVLIVAIGVGIDYALFIVTRYREELAAGRSTEQSVVTSISTAGRAVLFAGITVIISLLGLFVVGLDSMESLAVVMATGVFLVMMASITLLPALLGFVGHNIDKFGMPHRKSAAERAGQLSVWYRWSRFVQHRPWPILAVSLIILLVLAAPAFGIRLGFGDAGNRQDSDTTRRAYDTLAEGFGPGFNGPMYLAVDLSGDEADDEEVLDRLATIGETEGVDSATPPIVNEDGTVAFVQVFPTTSPQDGDTEDLVHRIRDEAVPAAVEGTDVVILVGGISAGVIDFAEYTFDKLPQFIAVVLILSFLLLMMVFRSLLVPLKAVIMNLLSIGAAYGVIVAFFQRGWFGDFLGEPGPIDAWVPVMMFAVVFGLSMDYEVFLLSRIREEYLRTGDNATAVADGLARTARLITAAALIMVFVFGGFLLSVDRGLRLFGMGMSVAVLIDATIVRMLLVPATMELLGDRNWWLPKWLDRILPRIGVD